MFWREGQQSRSSSTICSTWPCLAAGMAAGSEYVSISLIAYPDSTDRLSLGGGDSLLNCSIGSRCIDADAGAGAEGKKHHMIIMARI